MFQSVPDTVLFRALFSGPDNRAASFGLYSRNTAAAWDAGNMTTIADALRDAIIADYMPHVSNEWSFDRIISRDLEPQFGRVIEHAPVPTVGGVLVPSLPHEVALAATFIGEPGAAPSRGRIYLLPPAESQVDGSTVTAAALALLQTAAESMHNAMSGAGPAHVIVSRFDGTQLVAFPDGTTRKVAVKRPVGLTNTVPTVIVRGRVDSQRARRPAEV